MSHFQAQRGKHQYHNYQILQGQTIVIKVNAIQKINIKTMISRLEQSKAQINTTIL